LFSQDGSDILQSFEFALNLSYLQRAGYDPVPRVNGKADMAVQSFANEYTDALVEEQATLGAQYSAMLDVSAVPEPENYALMLAGLGLVGLIARRRKA
jgi:hypothetical protein